jgi:hypothetical protein
MEFSGELVSMWARYPKRKARAMLEQDVKKLHASTYKKTTYHELTPKSWTV